jgi:hypothetical protein
VTAIPAGSRFGNCLCGQHPQGQHVEGSVYRYIYFIGAWDLLVD